MGLFDEREKPVKIGPGLVLAWKKNRKLNTLEFFFADNLQIEFFSDKKSQVVNTKVMMNRVLIGKRGDPSIGAQFIRTTADFDDFVAILCRMFGCGFDIGFFKNFARVAQLREWTKDESEGAKQPTGPL